MTTPFLGSVQYFAFNYAPRGWNQCNGQILNINQYQALFALLGTYYGGNGSTTFALPDLRGRTILGWGQSSAHSQPTNYVMGQKGGVAGVTMSSNSLPIHNHSLAAIKMQANNGDGSQGSPVNAYPAKNGDTGENEYNNAVTTNTFLGAPQISVSVAGASAPFSNLAPYLALNACIAMTGIFPSRN